MQALRRMILYGGLFMYLPAETADYEWISGAGGRLARAQLVSELAAADVILFGEIHDSAVGHRAQWELLRDLDTATSGNLAVGMEMFERDDAAAFEDWNAGRIDLPELESRVRKWPNYESDYRPLLIPVGPRPIKVYPTNAPRKIAGTVAREGILAVTRLSDQDRLHIAPPPYYFDKDQSAYARMREMPPHAGLDPERMIRAQALKDRTMAWFLLRTRRPGQVYLHIHGSWHSDDYSGIYYYLKLLAPNLKVVTITTTRDQEHRGADYILRVRE